MKSKHVRVGSSGRKGPCRSVLTGVLTSVMIFLLLLTATALLVDAGTLPLDKGKIGVKLAFATALLFGCWRTARRSAAGKLLRSLCTAAITSIAAGLSCCLSAEGDCAVLPLLGAAAAAALLGALLGSKQKKSVL